MTVRVEASMPRSRPRSFAVYAVRMPSPTFRKRCLHHPLSPSNFRAGAVRFHGLPRLFVFFAEARHHHHSRFGGKHLFEQLRSLFCAKKLILLTKNPNKASTSVFVFVPLSLSARRLQKPKRR